MVDPTAQKSSRSRSDGRKSLLVYMEVGLIKEIKKLAVDLDRNVYDLVEEATKDLIKRLRRPGK